VRTRRTGLRVLQATALGLGAALSIAGVGLLWLSQESARPLDEYWRERLGTAVEIRQERELLGNGLHADRITIYSDTGLRAGFQVLRKDTAPGRSPVLVILGGQETGAEAIHLFEQSGPKAVIAIDYPYDGSREFRGIVGFFRNLPAMRSACRDTPASVSLVLDWLTGQEWVDPDRIVGGIPGSLRPREADLDALLELVALREPCYKLTPLDPRMPDSVIGRVGMMARVVEGGVVRVGDSVAVV